MPPIDFPSTPAPTPGQKYTYEGRVWEYTGVAWRALSGPTIEIRERRHQYVSPYSYCGTAPFGSLESATVWEISRIQVLGSGSTVVTRAANVAWTNRLTATYA
jgi:hypothetical protein